MSNKAFYLEKKYIDDKHLVKFLNYKSDIYRFRCDDYYFKSLNDQQRFRQNKRFDFKENYKKNIREIDTSIGILNNLNKRHRFRGDDGKIQSSNKHLPNNYNDDVQKILERRNIADINYHPVIINNI